MDNEQKLKLRRAMADDLRDVNHSLSNMLTRWLDGELPGDFLCADEYPFDQDLEELIARVNRAVEAIEEGNEWLKLTPITLKVSRAEYDALLEKLEEPAKPLPRLAEALRKDTRFQRNG
jgi:hypothetical protein